MNNPYLAGSQTKRMSVFTTHHEKKLWLYALLVWVLTLLNLFLGGEVVKWAGDQNLQAVVFVVVMVLIALVIIVHGLKKRTQGFELVIWLGLAAAFIMFFLRLSLAERSHLMEFSVLALFIHAALLERFEANRRNMRASAVAFLMAAFIGVLDEVLQLWLPGRHFEWVDVLFNTFAVFGAITGSMILQLIRRRLDRGRVE